MNLHTSLPSHSKLRSDKKKTAEHQAWSPSVVLDTVSAGNRKIVVAREDLLPGGTKQRAIIPYLERLTKKGYTEFVYASPFCGFAQIALAVSAQALGLKARIFCERNANTHYASVAQSFGAEVTFVDSLNDAHVITRVYASARTDRYAIPLGFADPLYIDLMTDALIEQYDLICKKLSSAPKRIWLPVGSGTLARIFAEIVDPNVTQLLCVNVRVLEESDHRISGLHDIANVTLTTCDELFCEPASELPPLPSNLNYDAKLWRHIAAQAEDGDLWWNVAR